MKKDTIVYLLPLPDYYTEQIPGYQWVYDQIRDVVYVLSDEKIDFPSKTLKELVRELSYNPFEQSGPLTDDQQLMLDINTNLEYLVCLADLGLLGGEI